MNDTKIVWRSLVDYEGYQNGMEVPARRGSSASEDTYGLFAELATFLLELLRCTAKLASI